MSGSAPSPPPPPPGGFPPSPRHSLMIAATELAKALTKLAEAATKKLTDQNG